MRCLITFVLILLLVKFGFAQGNDKELTDPVSRQMQVYKVQKEAPSLFVHFDKNIYTNNETAWFTGYLTNANVSAMENHRVLSLALIRNSDSAIIKQQKFLMARGLSFGDMVLPDSMQAGNYHFMATTNRVSKGVPDVVFIQQITIKTNLQPSFNANVKLLEAGIAGQKPSQLVVSVTTKDSRFLPKPVDIQYRYGKLSKLVKTNASGELLLSLDEQVNLPDPNLYLKLKYGKDSSYLNMNMPVTRRHAIIRFYPEGGNMVTGLPGRVAWEAKDQQGAVLSVKAVLFKDQEVVDTVETNKYGIGKFMLAPEKGKTYVLKLIHSGFADSAYLLPPAQDQGLVLFIRNGAVKDTLVLVLKNNLPNQRLWIRIHNFRETFTYASVRIHGPYNGFKIPMTAIPAGLNAITVTDTLDRPYAERLFFAHYNPARKIGITAEQNVFNQRQNVNLKLQLTGADSIAIVSVACVQANRMADKQSTDIESYNLLGRELSQVPVSEGRGIENLDFMEDLLLVRGWSRYSWQDLWKARAPDTEKVYDDTDLSIKVDKVKKPVQLGMLKGRSVVLLTTTANGEYHFKLDELLLESGKKMHILNTTADLAIRKNDPYERFNKGYLKLVPLEPQVMPSTVQNNRVLALKDNETAIRLKEVVINSKKDNGFFGRGPSGSNACGDYVCSYNILNCPNHFGDFGNTQPIPGYTYQSRGGPVRYQACEVTEENKKMIPLAGIYTQREFYKNDYADLQEPAFVSTLYWNHGVLIDTKGRQISFYTGDITGKFRLIVQGISNKGLLYGDYTFEVKGN